MPTFLRRWRQRRRYRTTLRQLRSLRPEELRALGIARKEIKRLAREAARL